jgi:hypothetical protein
MRGIIIVWAMECIALFYKNEPGRREFVFDGLRINAVQRAGLADACARRPGVIDDDEGAPWFERGENSLVEGGNVTSAEWSRIVQVMIIVGDPDDIHRYGRHRLARRLSENGDIAVSRIGRQRPEPIGGGRVACYQGRRNRGINMAFRPDGFGEKARSHHQLEARAPCRQVSRPQRQGFRRACDWNRVWCRPQVGRDFSPRLLYRLDRLRLLPASSSVWQSPAGQPKTPVVGSWRVPLCFWVRRVKQMMEDRCLARPHGAGFPYSGLTTIYTNRTDHQGLPQPHRRPSNLSFIL